MILATKWKPPTSPKIYPFKFIGWMAKTFFTGGTMPSHDLLLHFQRDLKLEKRWSINGQHYAKTLDAWLARMDSCYNEVWPILQDTYGQFAFFNLCLL